MAKSFRFRLQSIVRLRERERDAAAESLRQALQAKQILEGQVDELIAERNDLNSMRSVSENGHLDPQQMINAQRYQMYLDGQVAGLRQQISLVEQESQRRRAALVKCEQAVRSLEKLEEHQLAEWNSHQASNDQNTLDEWSGFRYWTHSQSTPTDTPST